MRWLKSGKNIFFLFSVLFHTVYAQNYTKLCEEADRLFPEADKVILSKNYHIEIIPQKDTVQFVSTNKEVCYVRKNGRFYGKESIYYSSEFSKLSDVSAYTINLATNKKTKFAGYAKGMYFSSNIFYDDNCQAYFVYPDLGDQCITTLEYKMDYSEPRLIPPYYFSYSDPFLSSSVTITFPPDCEIGWLVQDQGCYNIAFTEKKVKNKNEYTWTLQNTSLKGSASEDIPVSKVYPHVIIWVKKYTTGKGERKVLGSIDDLYGWYKDLVGAAKTNNVSVVKTTADSITRDLSSDYDKAAAIYSWVQNNISYVAIEDGYSGFIPRKADDVIRKKYGDCKDMANLLVEMMKNSGLDARHVWIGTRDIPYTYYDVHTPIVDNHMIATVKLDGKFYFLDATGKYMPFGLPTSMIQGKIGMIENDSSFILEKIGVMQPELSIIRDSIHLEIEDKKIVSSGTYSMSGYPMIFAQYAMSYAKNNRDKEDDYYKELLMKGSNKFRLLDYKLDDYKKEDKKMNISYDFELNDYVPSSDKEMFINLNISKTNLAYIDEKNNFLKVVSTNDYNYVKEDIFQLTIPENYEVQFTPVNNTIEKDFITYSNEYYRVGNSLVLKRKIVINYLELNKDQLPEFNSVVKEIQKIERSNVSLITH